MKNFTFNLLQQLNKKKADKGFTLIELLVVIIIIGILSAIALPAFLNQAAKAKQSEAKQALGSLNRGQQAYRLENPTFANTIANLALGLDTTTKNYNYGSGNAGTNAAPASGTAGTVGSFGLPTGATIAQAAMVYADAIDDTAVRTYQGGVGASIDPSQNATTITILCEGASPGVSATAPALTYTAVSGTTPASMACGASANEL